MSYLEKDLCLYADLIPEPSYGVALSERIRARISFLEQGVQNALLSPQEQETVDEELEGSDNGLYPRLVELAQSLDYRVEDDDEVTKDILRDGRKGLRKGFVSGWMLMVKQSSPLQKFAILGHELAHHFTPPIQDREGQILSESVAEGVAFVVSDHYGLDISKQSFPHIAQYNAGKFTQEMKEMIEIISMWMVLSLPETNDTAERS